MVIAVVSEIAAATIAVAIATDLQDWMAMAFFAAIGCAAWIAGGAAR
jgi:hypothetical protein